jgi:elongation factor Ts
MAEITATLVKQLRDRTGAGMMDCKKALQAAGGDIEEGEIYLRKQGVAKASKKASRATKQGVIGTYVHPGSQLGVMIEVNCESDFVARTDDFLGLVHDLAMQVAAADPKFVRREEVTEDVLSKEREIARDRALAEGKPEKILDKIVEGRLNKLYEEICLLEQPYIKENSTTVEDLIKQTIAKLGENIGVARFARFKIGETATDEPAEKTAE